MVRTMIFDNKKFKEKPSDHFEPWLIYMKYASLPEAYCCVLDMVKYNMVILDASFNSTLRQMLCRILWYLEEEAPIPPLT